MPLEMPRLLLIERRTYLAVPRQRGLNQLLARQSPPRHENGWRFRVDLGYVGESALSTGRIELAWSTALSATSHGLGMTPGIALIYPVQCQVATRRAHGSHLAPARCSATMQDFSAKREKKSCDTGTFLETRKKASG